jgi:hypothetical protein
MGGLAHNHGTFRIGPILAWKIIRENRVKNCTVGMTGLTVVMVRLRVHMDQRNGQHPGGQPRHEDCTSLRHAGKPVLHIFLHSDLVSTVAQNA